MTFWSCPASLCAVFDGARASDSAGPFFLLNSQTFPVGVFACKENEIVALAAVTRESDIDQTPVVTIV